LWRTTTPVFNPLFSHSEHYTHLPGQIQAAPANRWLSAGYKTAEYAESAEIFGFLCDLSGLCG
jgi:hypothetical protein